MIKEFNFEELDLKGAFKIQPFYATDERGGFVKDYNIDIFKSNGIEHELKEVFYTISKRGCDSCYALPTSKTPGKTCSLHQWSCL